MIDRCHCQTVGMADLGETTNFHLKKDMYLQEIRFRFSFTIGIR